jgi:hypothetical protein
MSNSGANKITCSNCQYDICFDCVKKRVDGKLVKWKRQLQQQERQQQQEEQEKQRQAVVMIPSSAPPDHVRPKNGELPQTFEEIV